MASPSVSSLLPGDLASQIARCGASIYSTTTSLPMRAWIFASTVKRLVAPKTPSSIGRPPRSAKPRILKFLSAPSSTSALRKRMETSLWSYEPSTVRGFLRLWRRSVGPRTFCHHRSLLRPAVKPSWGLRVRQQTPAAMFSIRISLTSKTRAQRYTLVHC